jgi:hypothetical protein
MTNIVALITPERILSDIRCVVSDSLQCARNKDKVVATAHKLGIRLGLHQELSLLIPSTSAPRLAFSPCFTLGARTCSIIPTCIVWSPAVVSLPTAANGFPAGVHAQTVPGSSKIY